jgi:hypothetical protein
MISFRREMLVESRWHMYCIVILHKLSHMHQYLVSVTAAIFITQPQWSEA